MIRKAVLHAVAEFCIRYLMFPLLPPVEVTIFSSVWGNPNHTTSIYVEMLKTEIGLVLKENRTYIFLKDCSKLRLII